jgi:hypothetical protein
LSIKERKAIDVLSTLAADPEGTPIALTRRIRERNYSPDRAISP